MSTSLGGAAARCSSRLRTLLSARCTEPTAARNDGIAPVIVTSAAHVFPLLQNGATSCPWLSKMPMLHGLSVMSALAMATTCTTAPGCVLFVTACTLSDSQCTRKISVCATTSSDGGAVGVGGARTATTARVPPTGNVMVTRQVFPLARLVPVTDDSADAVRTTLCPGMAVAVSEVSCNRAAFAPPCTEATGTIGASAHAARVFPAADAPAQAVVPTGVDATPGSGFSRSERPQAAPSPELAQAGAPAGSDRRRSSPACALMHRASASGER